MGEFDILVINIYLLTIFTILVKSKTISPIYRFFKLLIVALFIWTFMTGIIDGVPAFEIVVKGFPVALMVVILIQTEVSLVVDLIGFKIFKKLNNKIEDPIKVEVIQAVDHLSRRQIGALITFEKNTSMNEFINSAFPVNAMLNSDLLSTIFYPNTPLHDGAVIVREGNIICAGAYYPSTERTDIPKELGSRHRAAIGISEVTDSLTIVISEQSGQISVALDGYLDQDISKEALLLYLEKHLQV
ncbi:MAG: diadenylate cyclase [Candidatus Izemoplasmataceae bacterium]